MIVCEDRCYCGHLPSSHDGGDGVCKMCDCFGYYKPDPYVGMRHSVPSLVASLTIAIAAVVSWFALKHL